MAWRVAKSLEKLRSQVNAKFPRRNKANDGTIGDEAHASRSSDHNPWVKDGSMGVVTGMDITNDPKSGIDSGALAEALRASRDLRIKYIISNARICSGAGGPAPWIWRKYGGANAHRHHVHISVRSDKPSYDSVKPWEAVDDMAVITPVSFMPEQVEEIADDPIKETAVVSVDKTNHARTDEIQASAEADTETRTSWVGRKWKTVTGWFSGVGGVGVLGYLTDWKVVAVLIGGSFAIVVIVVLFMGPGQVRAWLRKQVS